MRVRFKVFGSFHTTKLEQEVNEWLRKIEERGYYPHFIKKEMRTTVSPDGRAWTVVSFFYVLYPIEEELDPAPEVDYDELEAKE